MFKNHIIKNAGMFGGVGLRVVGVVWSRKVCGVWVVVALVELGKRGLICVAPVACVGFVKFRRVGLDNDAFQA